MTPRSFSTELTCILLSHILISFILLDQQKQFTKPVPPLKKSQTKKRLEDLYGDRVRCLVILMFVTIYTIFKCRNGDGIAGV